MPALIAALLFLLTISAQAQRLPMVLIAPKTFWVPDMGMDPRYPPLRHQGRIYFGVKGGVALLVGRTPRVQKAVPDEMALALSPTAAGGGVFGLTIVRDEVWAAVGDKDRRQLLAFDAWSLRPLGEKRLTTWSSSADPAQAGMEVHHDPYAAKAWLTGGRNLICLDRASGAERQHLEAVLALIGPDYGRSAMTLGFDHDWVWLHLGGEASLPDRWLFYSRALELWQCMDPPTHSDEELDQLSRVWIWTQDALWGLPVFDDPGQQRRRDFLRLPRRRPSGDGTVFQRWIDTGESRAQLLAEIRSSFNIADGLNYRAMATLAGYRNQTDRDIWSDRRRVGRLAMEILEVLGSGSYALAPSYSAEDKPSYLLVPDENGRGMKKIAADLLSYHQVVQPEGRDPLILTSAGAATVDGDQVSFLANQYPCIEVWDGMDGEWKQTQKNRSLVLAQKMGSLFFNFNSRRVNCALKASAAKSLLQSFPAQWGETDRQGRTWSKAADGLLIQLP